jgi:hypothetical protein
MLLVLLGMTALLDPVETESSMALATDARKVA